MRSLSWLCREAKLPMAELKKAADCNDAPKRIVIRKRDASIRVVYDPPPIIRKVQRAFLPVLHETLALHPAACAFRRGYSVLDFVKPHEDCDVLIRLDLADCYGQFSGKDVRRLFKLAAFRPAELGVLVKLFTLVIDGRRQVPQGYPASPLLVNALLAPLDTILGKAAVSGWRYTRYADDLALSCAGDTCEVSAALQAFSAAVAEVHLTLNEKKTRVCYGEGRLAGLVVSPGPIRAPRALWRRLRAGIHNQKFGRGSFDELQGLYALLRHVQPERAAKFAGIMKELKE